MSDFSYKEMLEIGKPFDPSDLDLNKLAEFMAIGRKRIPAGYTYLGQFIDHDLSLDSAAADKIFPWQPIAAASITNRRSPYLDLDSLYGSEFSSSLKKEPARELLLEENSYSLLKLGYTIEDTVSKTFPNDLWRIPGSPIALVVDSRNDENLAVAQTHVAFVKFHNAVCKYLNENDTKERFEKARGIVIRHYQWIVLKDFLPRILKESILNEVLTKPNQFYFPSKNDVFMPLEHSVGAYRFGHTMIRDSYNWNRIFNDDPTGSQATLFHLAKFTGRGHGIKERLPSDWIINWRWFFNIANSAVLERQKFNFANRIDTDIAKAVGSFKTDENQPFPPVFEREFSIPALDLYRARALGLPTGQAVAERILGSRNKVLMPEQIANLLPDGIKFVFSKQTPLWFYLLAEAEIEERGQNLGAVGSRIIGETFVGILRLTTPSILNEDFQPDPAFCNDAGEFGMPEMLQFIAANNPDYDELNPLAEETAGGNIED